MKITVLRAHIIVALWNSNVIAMPVLIFHALQILWMLLKKRRITHQITKMWLH